MKLSTIKPIGAALIVGFLAMAVFYSPAHAGSKFGVSLTLPLDVNLWKSHGTVTVYAERYNEDVYTFIDNSIVNNTDNSVNDSNNGNSSNHTNVNQTSISSHQHNNVHMNGIGNNVNIGR